MTPDSLYYSVSTIPTRWSRIFVHWWTVPLDHRAIAWNSPFNWVKYKSPGCCACACGCGCRKGCCGSWSRLLWFLLGKWIPSLPLWHFFPFCAIYSKKIFAKYLGSSLRNIRNKQQLSRHVTPRAPWSDPATIGREDLEWWTSRGLGGERPDLSFRTVNQSAVKRTTCFFWN